MSFSTAKNKEFADILHEIRSGTKVISLSGLTSVASKAFILNSLQLETKKPFVIVTDGNREIETFLNDLTFFRSSTENQNSNIFSLPNFENDVYSGVSPHAETLEQRALTLWNLTNITPNFLVTSAKALITRILEPAEVKTLGMTLKRDEDFSPDDLIEKLVACGYVREEPLANFGQFSMRGGIIDVWSPNAKSPVRLEFFGDTVDSIREFDAETQLSIQHLNEISIAPMREFPAKPQDFKDWSFFAREQFADDSFSRNLRDRTQFADEGEDFNGWENLFPIIQPRKASIFNYLKDCVFVIDEPVQIEQTLALFYETLDKRYSEIVEADDIGLKPSELFLTVEELRENLSKVQKLELRALGRTANEFDEQFQVS
jgi:transcription-repair coupling factor (superfamily II helicase)